MSRGAAHFHIALLAGFAFAVLSTLASAPLLAVLVIDLGAAVALMLLFRREVLAILFLLHPAAILLSSQLFDSSFLKAGDGQSYRAVYESYFHGNSFTFTGGHLIQSFGFLDLLKYTSFGIVPVYAIPEYFFAEPDPEIYYAWQGALHVLLCFIAASLGQAWQVTESKKLFVMTLVAAVWPSFFELGATPTRHIVTFFAVFLLFVSHLAVMQRATPLRLFWLGVAILLLLVSKAPLLAPYLLFAAADVAMNGSRGAWGKTFVTLSVVSGVGIALLSFFITKLEFYNTMVAHTGGASLTGVTSLPIVGWVAKYVYAILSPFPWSDAPTSIEVLYGGNDLLFYMHILSALTGLYLFMVLALKGRALLRCDLDIKRSVGYGAVMSSSILLGSIGFHTYLLIYFPFLAVMITDRRLTIHPLLPLVVAALLEVAVVSLR